MVSLKSFKLIHESERDETTGNEEVLSQHLATSNEQQVATLNAASFGTGQSGENNNNSKFNNNNSLHHQNTRRLMGAIREDKVNMKAHCENETIDKDESNNMTVVAVTLPTCKANKQEVVYENSTNEPTPITASPSSSSISIVVVRQDNNGNAHLSNEAVSRHSSTLTANDDHSTLTSNQSLGVDELDDAAISESNQQLNDTITNGETTYRNNNMIMYSQPIKKVVSAENNGSAKLPRHYSDPQLSVNTESEHFEIVWSNLCYKIEPKWYKKINFIDRMFSHLMPGQTIDNHSSATSTASSSAGMNDNQHQMHHSSQNADSHLSNIHRPKSNLDPIEIFANLNGTIKSGQMTAVLGPSGAGKTTLLNCLTGKLRKGVSGHINLRGANGKHLKMCTIPQKDHLLELLTVEENLWFASKIKNPEYGFDHVKNIERVIDLLGLKRCRSAKIKKISGGQHKRVSIAQELLSNPDILVLDEPTSGLDSLTCYKTISMLRDLVELSANNDFMKPMAIIVTIHQPQPKVFNLFHHVYILANGGRVIYEGAPELSLDTITSVTALQPIDGSKSTSLTPGSIDPASFLIEIASEEYGTDVINTLNDYQRRIFYDNNSHHTQNHSHRVDVSQFNIQDASLGAKDNHGFSPEFEDGSKSNSVLPTVFVSNRSVDKSHHNNEHQAQHTISDEVSSKKGSKTRRRKRSIYGMHDNNNLTNKETSADTHNSGDGSFYMSEQLLYTRVPNHKGRFWSHTATLAHRTLLTIRRDPLLMTSRVLFHLMIPILMSYVYGTATGAANACPQYEPEIDITQIPSLVEGKRIEYMLEELHMSIENVSMFFIIMYAFAAAVLALNALSFPLNMQVLLKETRNGWYSMSSYVLAKTLADLPLELTMPCLTMALVYPLTGQPSSYLQWRMLTICLIMTLCSLIAQTQALILGALVMNSVQTAVFVSQASQLPWVILAGFTIRIKRLSDPLKLISLTSFYRLGCEAITLTRYGFGICPCDPKEITGEPVKLVGIPDQLRTVAQYWLDSMEASKANNDSFVDDETADTTVSSLISTTTNAPPGTKADIFQHLANQLSYANSYGVNITSCDDVAPDRIRAINLGDNWLVARIWHLFIMLIIMKVLLYYAVKFSIGIRL